MIAAVLLRLARLAVLPGEMYGDITIVWEYVDNIRRGRWPTYFDLSSGPLYHYLVVPVVWVTGLDFEGLKVASVVVSLSVLGVTYGFVRDLADRQLAILTLFVASISSWLLVFSRLGNSQIVTPLLSMGALWLVVRVARREEWWNAALCGVVAAAGLYEYPQTFVLAPVALVTLVALRLTGVGIRWRDVKVFAAAACLTALPFTVIVWRQRETSSMGTSEARSRRAMAAGPPWPATCTTRCSRFTPTATARSATTPPACRTSTG